MISATILADSETPHGNRLTTWELTYPRFIHAEFMTHRGFSRNAASSRAIPIQKMQQAVLDNPATPEFWGSNKAGMQAGDELVGDHLETAKSSWKSLSGTAVMMSRQLETDGLHKQIANRVLEPFGHITVIATASLSCHLNFFALRAHPDAQPEFQVLAYRMLAAYLRHKPQQLPWGAWHLPFSEGVESFTVDDKLKVCTGRIARVSYLTHDGRRSPSEDMALHDRLKVSGHWSPFEHCAQASTTSPKRDSNFGRGWLQYRKEFRSELKQPSLTDLKNVLASRPKWFNL